MKKYLISSITFGIAEIVMCPSVATILENIGLEEYTSKFEDADIDYEAFISMDKDHLQELDITLGDRIKIMKEVIRLKEQEKCSIGKKSRYVMTV